MNAPVQNPQPVDVDTRIQQYVQLRDKIKELDDEHKQKMKPYRETLEKLNNDLLDRLNQAGVDSMSGAHGTFYRTEKASASIADMDTFWAYVVTQGDFDLVDRKANVTAVKKHIEEHNMPPPGVNYQTTHVVGVRRK